MIDVRKCESLPGWFPPPHGYADIRAEFGQIVVDRGQIVPSNWERENMIMLAPGAVPGWPHRLYTNRKTAPVLMATLQDCVASGVLAADPENAGGLFSLKTLGSFAPRCKRSNPQALSLHTWGIAVDINADDNPAVRIRVPADLARVVCTIPKAMLDIFRSWGWTLGIDFGSYKDPMHAQFASGY